MDQGERRSEISSLVRRDRSDCCRRSILNRRSSFLRRSTPRRKRVIDRSQTLMVLGFLTFASRLSKRRSSCERRSSVLRRLDAVDRRSGCSNLSRTRLCGGIGIFFVIIVCFVQESSRNQLITSKNMDKPSIIHPLLKANFF